MKKTILIFATLLGMLNISNAQEDKTDYRTKLTLGFKAGFNYSNVYNAKGEEFVADPKFGLATGAFLSIPIGKYLGVQPELLFSQKGLQASGQILGGNYRFTRTTNYIDIPLLFVFKPSEYFTLLAGPEYSYLLSQKDVFTSEILSSQQQQEFTNENLRKNTFGLLVGSDLTIKHVVIGARAGWDITNNNGDGTSTTPQYKNVWYQLTFGFRL
jgi:hypothetical protein